MLLGGGVLLGVPIAFSFGLATVACLLVTTSTPLAVLPGRIDEGMSSLILLAVPLFIILGQLIEMTEMAKAMVAFLASLVGHVRGGLQYVLLGAMLLVSGISGAKTADMAAVAPVLFPEMRKRGLNDGEMVVAARGGGCHGRDDPAFAGADRHWLRHWRLHRRPVHGRSAAGRRARDRARGAGAPARRRRRTCLASTRAPLSRRADTFVVALPALILPVLIRTAVVEGVATATEVSTIGIAYAVLAGILIYRQFDWRRILPMLVETASLAGAILFIIGCANGMAWALTQSGFSHGLAATMAAVPGGAAASC